MGNPIRLGVSACLLGQNVRYDGGHKRNAYVADTLAAHFEFVPVCPEVECGLPVPREAMRLVGDQAAPRLVTVHTGIDLTERMLTYCARRVEELAGEHLCGYVFKSKSPSSGMARVKVYPEKGPPAMTGVGLFARAFMDRFPLLPVEEEGRLCDPRLRENFIERVFTLARYRTVLSDLGLDETGRVTAGGAPPGRRLRNARLTAFHAAHKYLLMSHSPKIAAEMGRLAAENADVPDEEILPRYQNLLVSAMGLFATPAKHVNVLMHLVGYFKKVLTPDEKAEFLEIVEEYRAGRLPLVVALTLISHFVRKYDAGYLKTQWYLQPHPKELMLRNHV